MYVRRAGGVRGWKTGGPRKENRRSPYKFQYNNHVHSATRETPFMLDFGQNLRMGFEPDQPESRLETVNEFKTHMQQSRSALAKAKDDMA